MNVVKFTPANEKAIDIPEEIASMSLYQSLRYVTDLHGYAGFYPSLFADLSKYLRLALPTTTKHHRSLICLAEKSLQEAMSAFCGEKRKELMHAAFNFMVTARDLHKKQVVT